MVGGCMAGGVGGDGCAGRVATDVCTIGSGGTSGMWVVTERESRNILQDRPNPVAGSTICQV